MKIGDAAGQKQIGHTREGTSRVQRKHCIYNYTCIFTFDTQGRMEHGFILSEYCVAATRLVLPVRGVPNKMASK